MKMQNIDANLITAIEKQAVPLSGALQDYDLIMEAVADKQFVLIGEASHGTKEFYKSRAQITKRLIDEQGFDAVAVEADWPDAYTVNRYVSGINPYTTSQKSLSDFERFPSWMWRNTEVLKFVEWLHGYNQEYYTLNKERVRPVGFYGLDLYSMNTSINAVVSYLETVDPLAARRARNRYACLDHFVRKPKAHSYKTDSELDAACEKEIIAQLIEMKRKEHIYMKQDGFVAEDEYFCAEQNAKLILNAKEYYSTMLRGRASSWNMRDQHMFETLENITNHLSRQLGRNAKIVVWAHNSHIGNAAATEMSKRDEFNIGQLMRRVYGKKTMLIGFSTCRGTVTAANDWDARTLRKSINEPYPGSYEEVFHHVNHKQFLLNLMENNDAVDLLMEPRLQRAIGVIYRPDTERYSHYIYSCLPRQFDFILHFDETNAVEPLDTADQWHHGELDETYPSGL